MRSLDNDKLIEGRPSGGAPGGAARDYLSRPGPNQTEMLATTLYETSVPAPNNQPISIDEKNPFFVNQTGYQKVEDLSFHVTDIGKIFV